MKRYIRKLRGAIRDPQRAARILWNDGLHKVYARLRFAPRKRCTFKFNTTTIVFDTSDSYSKEWFYPRCADGSYHEPAVTELCIQLAPSAPSFVDVGAHLGYFSILMGKLMNSRPVLAYEMDDRAYERLKRNVALNLLNNLQLHHIAIAGEDKTISYRRLPMLDSGESISYEGSDDPERSITGVTLDRVFSESGIKPGVIKIDVEGAEHEVLMGAHKTLSQTPVLLLEIHGKKLALFGSDSQKVIALLEEKGYDVYEIQDHRMASTPSLLPLTSNQEPFERNTMTLVLPKDHSIADMPKLWNTL